MKPSTSAFNLNILKNITPENPVWQAVAEELWDRIRGALAGEGVPEDRLGALGGVAAPLAADTYFLHYSFYPMLRPEEEIPDELLKIARKAFEEYMQSEDYKRVRPLTRLNRSLSEVFTIRFASELVKQLLERIPELPQLLQRLQQGQGGGGAQQAAPQAVGGQAGNYSCKSGKCRKRQQNTPGAGAPQQQQQQRQGSSPGGGEALRRLEQAFREAFREAAKAAEKATRAASELASLSKGFTPAELAFADRELGLPEAEFEALIRVLGTLKRSMPLLLAKVKKTSRRGLPRGYTLTRNPARALPRELALPEELFEYKLARGGFTARERVSPKKGVMIVLLDRSGSMSGYKMGWAKAVALALAAKARREGLDYYLIPFDAQPHEPMTLEDIRDIARITAGGGTDIALALDAAFNLVEDKHYKHANIILITDGADDSPETHKNEIIQRAKKDNATIKVFFIEGDNKALREIAKATKGALYTVQPTEQEALKIIEKA